MPFRPTHAMILAAGLGTRMRPLTDDRPKPMIEVDGRALIDHCLDRLEEAGITNVAVNIHYKAEMMRKHLKDRKGLRIHLSDETDRLMDSGGGVAKALPLLGTGPFLTINCDSLWLEGTEPNLTRLIGQWDESRMDALMLLAPVVKSSGYDGRGDFLMDSEGRLVRRPNPGTAPFVWAGVQIVSPRLFKDVPDDPFSFNLLWDRAIEAGRLFGIRMDGFWMHVGTPTGRDDAEHEITKSRSPEMGWTVPGTPVTV